MGLRDAGLATAATSAHKYQELNALNAKTTQLQNRRLVVSATVVDRLP